MRLRKIIGTLGALALLGILVGSPVFAGPAFDSPGVDHAMAAQERHTDRLFEIQGVVGTAVGLGADGQHVVKIYTEEPGIAGLPRKLDGIPVVVQVTGKIFAVHHACGHTGGRPGSQPLDCPEDPPSENVDPTARFDRPVPIGVSTGHPLEPPSAGSIGARVTDGGNVYALSNNHVYAASNAATKFVDKVLQPGYFDGGSDPADMIGTLDDFEPIVFSTLASNEIDAAIALSSTADLGNATPPDGYGLPKSATHSASLNKKVLKYGRTTGLTKGQITGINATVDVDYGGFRIARFVNQIVVESRGKNPFGGPGDSGSLIVSDDRNHKREPVALLFALGSFLGNDFTFANPIDEVLTRFGVTIDGE